MFQDCFIAYYQSLSQRLRDHFHIAAEYFDPDSIHDLRVEIKQLRAFFRLIEWLTPDFRAKKSFRKFRELFKAAAELRDVHVQQEFTRTYAKQFGLALYEYYNFLKQREQKARKHFAEFAKSFAIEKACAKNEQKLQQVLKDVADEQAAASTRAQIQQLMDEMRQFGRAKRLQREHLHKLRILTKEVRYTMDLARQCFPELGYTETFSETLRGLHQVLGKWHDIEIALERLAAFQTDSPEPITMVSVHEDLSHLLQQEKTDLLTTFEARWGELASGTN